MATLTIYTTSWCGPCTRLKGQLDRVGISYQLIDIEEDTEAAEFVMTANDGARMVPTVLFPDGSTLTNPSVIQVQDHLERSA